MLPSILAEVILAISNVYQWSCNVYVLSLGNNSSIVNFAMSSLMVGNVIPVLLHQREYMDIGYLSPDAFTFMFDYIRFGYET